MTVKASYSTPLMHVAEIIEVVHWGKPEQEAWDKRISQNA
jgi:hypothetical protein